MKFNPLISVNGIIIIDRQIIFDNNLFLNPVNMKIARTTEYAETSIDIVHKEPFNEPPSLFPVALYIFFLQKSMQVHSC
jgi:hypothetical protein